MNLFAIRLVPGQDLRKTLLTFCKARHIEAACIMTCVGSFERVVIRFADQPEGTVFEEKLEIVSLVGTLSAHGCHLHVSVSDAQGQVYGGHLLDGSRIYTTAEIVIGVMSGIRFKRALDERTGYKELHIEPILP